jgi:ubiquinone/menaquinone biosynthesis C-methylase UbiE
VTDIESDWVNTWSVEKIKETWDQKRASRVWRLDPAYREVAEAILSLGDSVIDIGCGGGMQCAAFQDFAPELVYQGIDIHPGMVEYARAAFPDVEFDRGNATDLPYEDNLFDVALLRHVLEHHSPDMARVILSEAIRVATKGLVILFFKPPHVGNDNPTRHRRVTVTHFSREWLIGRLSGLTDMSLSRKFIPRTPHARNDQELWTINLF